MSSPPRWLDTFAAFIVGGGVALVVASAFGLIVYGLMFSLAAITFGVCSIVHVRKASQSSSAITEH
ncbi:MAG: hypothetical protein AAF911_15375 [Planctomycetota bacterium]